MSNELSSVEIAELICTRISHDLVGNVGVIANGVELLEEGDVEFLDDIRSIFKTGSGVLASRLKFFRLAFGLNNTNLEDFDFVKEIVNNYLQTLGNKNYPIMLDWKLENSTYTKAVLVMIMIMADIFIRGGKINVVSENGRVRVFPISDYSMSDEKIKTVKNILNGEETEPSAQYAPVYFLISLLRKQKINLYVINSPNLELVVE